MTSFAKNPKDTPDLCFYELLIPSTTTTRVNRTYLQIKCFGPECDNLGTNSIPDEYFSNFFWLTLNSKKNVNFTAMKLKNILF